VGGSRSVAGRRYRAGIGAQKHAICGIYVSTSCLSGERAARGGAWTVQPNHAARAGHICGYRLGGRPAALRLDLCQPSDTATGL